LSRDNEILRAFLRCGVGVVSSGDSGGRAKASKTTTKDSGPNNLPDRLSYSLPVPQRWVLQQIPL
ncbi:hypothetical protein AVEN_171994-1, partial [Araneus ventricosus]